MPASHGTSLTHRNIGSTGQRDTPGKVGQALSNAYIHTWYNVS